MKYLITGNLDEQMVLIPLPHITEWESVEESGRLAFDEAGIVIFDEDSETWLYVTDWDDLNVVPEPEEDPEHEYWTEASSLMAPQNSLGSSETDADFLNR